MASPARQKAKCTSQYLQNSYITQTQRKFCTKYAETPIAQKYILNWVQSLEEPGRVESAHASGTPAALSDQWERVLYYFIRYLRMLLRGI